MILPSEGVARDWLNREALLCLGAKGTVVGRPLCLLQGGLLAASCVACLPTPPALWGFAGFPSGRGAPPGWRGACAVLQASDHRLAAWLQRPVNPTVSAARGREPSRGPGTLESSVSLCWPPPGGCSAHPPVLEEDQGVPHPLEPVSGNPCGVERSERESLQEEEAAAGLAARWGER